MGGVMTMKKMWNNLNIATKLILVFSMVSVMPLLVMSFVLYHISANSLNPPWRKLHLFSVHK